jgi:CBS domain-containing protein
MKVHEIMTAHARCVGPDNNLVEAAGLMRELDVGALPVCEEDRLIGIVTDRDLALRGIADGKDPNTTFVRDVMTTSVAWAFADQEVEEVVRLMEERQIRRVPVMSREKRLVGIVALGDIAISSSPAFSGMALRDVSEPREPTARQRRLAQRSQPPENLDRRNAERGQEEPTSTAAATRRRTSVRGRTTARKSSSRTSKTASKSASARRTRSRGAAKRSGAARTK